MPTIIVAVYHTIDNTDELRRALEVEGIRRDDIRISDYVDPVARNAPDSIEKPEGFLYWLTGVPGVDVEAYRQAIARGRTIVAVRVPDERAARIEAVLDGYDPIDLGTPETIPERERVLAEETGALPRRAPAGGDRPTGQGQRLRRYAVPDRSTTG